MDRELRKVLLYITGGLFFISGLVIVPFVVMDSTSRNWPVTEAVITSCEVRGKHLGSDDPLYILEVTYTYTVGGNTYTSANYGKHDDLDSKIEGQMMDMKEDFPVGSRITIAYDPDRPEFALMKPGIVWYHLTGLAIVAFSGICFSACMLVKPSVSDQTQVP